jgi:hypothetical protein
VDIGEFDDAVKVFYAGNQNAEYTSTKYLYIRQIVCDGISMVQHSIMLPNG